MNRCRSQIYYGCFLIINFLFFFIFGLFKSKAAKSRSLHTGLLKLLEKKPYTFNTGECQKMYQFFIPTNKRIYCHFRKYTSLGATLQRKECTLN